MEAILAFLIFGFIGSILCVGVSLSVLSILFVFVSLFFLISLFISAPIILMILLTATPFAILLIALYYLLQHYPQPMILIRKNILEKPKSLIQQHYLQPLTTLPHQPIHNTTRSLMLAGVWIAILAIGFLTYEVLQNGFMTQWNQPVYRIMREFRSPNTHAFWVQISLLNSFSMGLFWAVMNIYFIVKKDAWRSIHWLLLGLLIATITAGLKYGTLLPRPGAAFSIRDSFPSAHVSGHMTLLGGLIILANLHQSVKMSTRYLIYSICVIWVYLIAFSRLYLEAHWFTDIIGGVLVSLISLSLLGLSYYRKIPPTLNRIEFTSVSLTSLVGLWFIRFFTEYDRILTFYMASF